MPPPRDAKSRPFSMKYDEIHVREPRISDNFQDCQFNWNGGAFCCYPLLTRSSGAAYPSVLFCVAALQLVAAEYCIC